MHDQRSIEPKVPAPTQASRARWRGRGKLTAFRSRPGLRTGALAFERVRSIDSTNVYSPIPLTVKSIEWFGTIICSCLAGDRAYAPAPGLFEECPWLRRLARWQRLWRMAGWWPMETKTDPSTQLPPFGIPEPSAWPWRSRFAHALYPGGVRGAERAGYSRTRSVLVYPRQCHGAQHPYSCALRLAINCMQLAMSPWPRSKASKRMLFEVTI